MSESWFADLLNGSRFLKRYPHYASVLAQMEPMRTSEVESMAVALHRPLDTHHVVRLYVNVDYFDAHPEQFAGILLHEIHHTVYGHLSDERLHAVGHPLLMELAMEISANEGIAEPLPSAFRWPDFRKFGVRPNQSTAERYTLLCRAQRKGRLRVLDERQLDALHPRWRRSVGSDDGARSGPRVVVMPAWGRRLPWSARPRVLGPTMVDHHRPGRSGEHGDTGLGDALDRRSDDARPHTWRPGFGLDFPTHPAQLQRWQLAIRAHLRGEPSATAGLARSSKELPRPIAWMAELDDRLAWPRILRAITRAHRSRYPTYLRPSRRFPDRTGEIPGRSRRAPRPALLAGVDTSASMSADTLGKITVELNRLSRHATLTIAECDAAVQRIYPIRRQEILLGGGDTDFHPLFALARTSPHTYDGVLYFTDGKAPWPSNPPPIPTLWILTNTNAFDCPWGTVVRMSP